MGQKKLTNLTSRSENTLIVKTKALIFLARFHSFTEIKLGKLPIRRVVCIYHGTCLFVWPVEK